MADENSITVTSDDSIAIQLKITSQVNKIDTEFVQSISSVLAGHDNDQGAHSNIVSSIMEEVDADISDINTQLATKSDIATTYTKSEANTLLADKFSTSDPSVTIQGNTFNVANKLVKLNSSGQLPAIDGSNLTAFPSTVANIYLSNISLAQALSSLGFAGKSLTTNGYYKLPGGLIIQWGYVEVTNSTSNQTITFPVAFPTSCLNVLTQISYAASSAIAASYFSIYSKSATNFVATFTMSKYWLAIGY